MTKSNEICAPVDTCERIAPAIIRALNETLDKISENVNEVKSVAEVIIGPVDLGPSCDEMEPQCFSDELTQILRRMENINNTLGNSVFQIRRFV